MTSVVAGVLARLVRSPRTAARVVQADARGLLALEGKRLSLEGTERLSAFGGDVLIANRAGALDPLVLAAALPIPFLVAEQASLATAPGAIKFLLRPLVAPPVDGHVLPPGGTVRERIHQALEAGHSVLVFADNPADAPAPLVRFRLDGLRAAAALHRQVVPVMVTGTADLLDTNRSFRRASARVRVGEAILPGSTQHPELIQLRERVREAMGKLSE
jgi:1-acyl-sn-glycerol-3-phosphate acyltransferase